MAKLQYLQIPLAIFVIFSNENSLAHVSLTFPPGRLLNLDFLDFARALPPCGMPKGLLRTSVKAGSTINVTWDMTYPHRGGFRLELLDKNEQVIQKLSDPFSKAPYKTGDPTAQSYPIQLPDEPCPDCTIRLVRDANEFPNYGYWSCGDISIVKGLDFQENCFNRGKPNMNSDCSCENGYWGHRCQYSDECSIDSDCGSSGKCIDILGTSLPRRQCYCSPGFHGPNCLPNKAQLPTADNLVLSTYNWISLSDKLHLYFKLLFDYSTPENDREIEFVLQANGTSYIALGWRPNSITKECKTMPAIEEQYLPGNLNFYQIPKNFDQVSPYKLERKPSKYAPSDPLHPMDCSDIIIGTARGSHSRIRDYYTRDRSAPKLDTFYGGTEDISSASGWQNDSITTIIFRRALKTNDPTDHFLSGQLQVIWARGQETGQYIHNPHSGLEVETPSIPNFYFPDEIKYHGQSSQRGVIRLNLP